MVPGFPSVWALACVFWAVLASGISISPPGSAFLRTRNPSSSTASAGSAVQLLRRALSGLTLEERSTAQENSTSLDKSWEDAVLFAYTEEADVGTSAKGNTTVSAGVQITCTTCYVRGNATARFTIAEGFNASQAFSNFTREIGDEIGQLGAAAVDYVEEYFDGVVGKLDDGVDLEDFAFPPMNFSFDADLPEIPQCGLHFRFDGMELYMLVDTVLSAGATYTLNLYTSQSVIGFSVGDSLEIGVLFAIDLILSVDGEIDISSGFHIKLDDGVTMDLTMFSKDFSNVEFNGGQFEFLPVTIESAGVVLKAVLRLGVTVGFEIASPDVSIGGISITEASVGVEVGVYAHVAEFTTNVTASLDEDSDCALQVVESYQLALGAMAGASVAIDEHTWGPVPATEIPIFYTTLAEACAIRGRSSATASSAVTTAASSKSLGARDGDDDLTTTTISSETVYVGVACMSQDLVNCPASLQTTTKFTTTKTHVTVVSAESDATFPQATRTTAVSTIAFGSGAKKLLATSGSPVSYTPPPETTTASPTESDSESNEGDESSSSRKDNKGKGVPKATIIGVSVGLGVPALAGIVTIIMFWLKKRKQYAAVRKQEDSPSE